MLDRITPELLSGSLGYQLSSLHRGLVASSLPEQPVESSTEEGRRFDSGLSRACLVMSLVPVVPFPAYDPHLAPYRLSEAPDLLDAFAISLHWL